MASAIAGLIGGPATAAQFMGAACNIIAVSGAVINYLYAHIRKYCCHIGFSDPYVPVMYKTWFFNRIYTDSGYTSLIQTTSNEYEAYYPL